MSDGDGEGLVSDSVVFDRANTDLKLDSSDLNLVAIAIPSYNRSEMLYRTLYSYFRQQDPNYEVLVANDDDPDKKNDTSDVIRGFQGMGMPVKEFYTGQYKRKGRGWCVETYPYNVCIRQAKADIIILNSGDVMSVNNTINFHRHFHRENNNLVVFSTVHALTQEVQNNLDSYDWKMDPRKLLFKGSTYKMFTGEGSSYTNQYSTEEAHTPYHFQCSVLRKHLLDIRGFDEDFYGMMPCGDDDLAHRLKKKGLTFYWAKEPLAIHQFHGSPENLTESESVSNPNFGSGHDLYQKRMSDSIVRNRDCAWGEFPRNMAVNDFLK